MSVSDNIMKIRDRIAESAEASGRKAGDISLIAATKTQPLENVREAIAGGVDACGENRVQELTDKLLMSAYAGVPLHFIGHLQKNKLKKIVGMVDLIQSVDSLVLLEAIGLRARELEVTQDILIQVNIGKDPAKYGISPEKVPFFLDECEKCVGINVRGFMTILPATSKSVENRRLFAEMYKFYVDIKTKSYNNVTMDYLSMGMSGDFYEAILEGANMVRIGSSIFGQRN